MPVKCTIAYTTTALYYSITEFVSNGKRSSIGPEKQNRVLVIHENLEIVTMDCDYIVPIAESYNKPAVYSRIVYLSMRVVLLLLDLQRADISLVLQFFITQSIVLT